MLSVFERTNCHEEDHCSCVRAGARSESVRGLRQQRLRRRRFRTATLEAGKLTVSTSPDFPPYEYLDDSGAIIGIEPEILQLIADKLGLELVLDAMDFDSALLAVQQGKSDMVVSGCTVTEDRKLVMNFTDSYSRDPDQVT